MDAHTLPILAGVAMLVALPARAVGGTLTDGAVSLTYPPTHWGAIPVADLLGTEATPAADPVFATGWWYRAQGDTREYPLPAPDSESYDGANFYAVWNNLDGKGFQVQLRDYLFDVEGPSGAVWSTLRVTNYNGTPRTFETFHYLDAEAGGTATGDTGDAFSSTYLYFVDGDVVRYRAPDATHYMVRTAPQILTLLNDADVDDLDDTGMPFGPGDASAAFQFGGTPLTPGVGVFRGQVAFSSRLHRNFVKGAYADMTPYPALLYRHAGGYDAVQYMRRTTQLPLSTAFAGSSYVLQGLDDFEGRYANVPVHRDLATGVARINLSTIAGAPTLPLNWKLSATGDFNFDGKADLLWRNVTSQKLVIWTMNGNLKTGAIIPTPDQAVDGNWEVVAAADFDGDAGRDLLWYNQTSGKIVVWFMNASVQRTTGMFTTPPSVGNNNWRVVAAGDFGKGSGGVLESQDIVWQNDTSGRIVVWYMDHFATRTAGVFTSPDNVGAGNVVVGPR